MRLNPFHSAATDSERGIILMVIYLRFASMCVFAFFAKRRNPLNDDVLVTRTRNEIYLRFKVAFFANPLAISCARL